ncbi:hypothetical protein ANN_15271 [Periplaneta americana]|uniref:HAT C-terminal dimerisation domain-containing protein n=1 Tax=Periplaneta americana TaxID=6978 RepID=A0ABQ8SFY8_PERAM|nr:hypothetical protein ANN_15271 [Periplaneta americana]
MQQNRYKCNTDTTSSTTVKAYRFLKAVPNLQPDTWSYRFAATRKRVRCRKVPPSRDNLLKREIKRLSDRLNCKIDVEPLNYAITMITSEMIFGELRPKIRQGLHDIRLTFGENPTRLVRINHNFVMVLKNYVRSDTLMLTSEYTYVSISFFRLHFYYHEISLASSTYAPMTSVNVERSFSTFRNLLSENRRSFTPKNLAMTILINCNAEIIAITIIIDIIIAIIIITIILVAVAITLSYHNITITVITTTMIIVITTITVSIEIITITVIVNITSITIIIIANTLIVIIIAYKHHHYYRHRNNYRRHPITIIATPSSSLTNTIIFIIFNITSIITAVIIIIIIIIIIANTFIVIIAHQHTIVIIIIIIANTIVIIAYQHHHRYQHYHHI